MLRIREAALVLMMGACGSLLYHQPVRADAAPGQEQEKQLPPDPQTTAVTQTSGTQDVSTTDNGPQAQSEAPAAPGKLIVTVGKSLIIDSPLNITRVTIANGGVAEAVAVNPKEVLINGTAPGETSLIVWQQNGTRLVYDLTVRPSVVRLEAVRQQIARDFPADDISVTFENDTAFVRGRVKDVTSADRVISMASTLGRTVNLLNVEVPPVAPQVVLKVRFASVDRSATLNLGVNLFSGAFNQQLSVGTGSAINPSATGAGAGAGSSGSAGTTGSTTNNAISVGQAVNILLFRNDINLIAEIQALQAKNLIQVLAEPNVLAISGEQASLLAGGEFPFPVVQPSTSGTSAISIMWREYGVRLNFVPNVTPRGTIRLKVAPEVSSLDYANAVTVNGFTIPGLSSRRVQTEVELDNGQSFVIAGLLDNQSSDSLSKVPGIGSIPLIGKLFQQKTTSKNNSELLVIITPEVVRPIPAGQKLPELKQPLPYMPTNTAGPMSTPGMDQTGPVPVKPPVDSLPYEQVVPKNAPPALSFQPNVTTPQPMAPGPNPSVPAGATAPAGAIK